MKNIELHFLPGDEVWIKDQYKVCIIDQIILSSEPNGDIDVTYTWYNLEYGVDVNELWDDGDFSTDDIGKTVFSTYEELEQAFPNEYLVPEYTGDEF